MALALAGSLGAVAVATPTAALAAVTYGENASFHCGRGAGYAAIFFDKLSLPARWKEGAPHGIADSVGALRRRV